MAELMFEGLKDGGTFYVATATATAIGEDFDSAVGKVVTVTGNGEVGYGSQGALVRGVIDKVEKFDNSSDKLVATVLWNRTFEDIACGTGISANAQLVCDGAGGVKAATGDAPTSTGCYAISVDGQKAVIRVL